MLDYKIDYKVVSDGGIKVVVKFYEGFVTTESEMDDITGENKRVTHYRRTKVLGTETIHFMPGKTDAEIETAIQEKTKELYPSKELIDEQKPT